MFEAFRDAVLFGIFYIELQEASSTDNQSN
jgi:hypothetical protein